MLPIVEMLYAILAAGESISKNTNLADNWQLQIIALLTILGLSLSLAVACVKDLDRGVKLSIRLTGLSILSLVVVGSIVFLS